MAEDNDIASPRKPYTSPTLVTYGDAVTLTEGSRRQGRKDAAKSKMRTR